MLACARIGAPHNVVFGGFSPESVKERMEVSDAKALITADGARRKGKTAPVKQPSTTVGDAGARRRRRAPHRHRLPDGGRATSSTTRRMEAADGRVPGRAAGRRAPAVHPLLVGLDGQAEGDPAHDRRLPDRRRVDAQARLRPQARERRVLVLGRRRLDHRPLLHRLRAAAERRDVGHVRGRARLPAQGHLVGAAASATA